MRRARWGAAFAAACMLWTAAPAGAAEPTKEDKTFTVKVGPNRDQECKVVGYLYTPPGVDKDNPAPAILATNGFGGSRDDFDKLGPAYAKRGYVFLAYSGLGFGGSGCKITLDDREHDGAAGSQLIDFLGGLDSVKKDAPGDPRVGMIGGSYGGQIQFAIAGIDPRLDTIIPQITWNDLSYSLSPNNTDFTSGVTYGTPGVVKLDWPVLFFGLGTGQGLAAALADPSHAGQCPNFADEACPALVQGAARGYLDETGTAFTRHASVSSYISDIRIPTFITQGQSDNLFDLQEAVANYKSLKAQGVPVKMLWRSAGHSGGNIGKSENDATDLEGSYESRADLAWFDHYLKDAKAAPALDFSFLTDWIGFDEGKDAAASVGVVPAYPAAPGEPLFLSGADALVADRTAVKEGTAQMAEQGAPTSTGGNAMGPTQEGNDAPGTSVSYTTAPLDRDLDLVGIPSVTFRVDAPTFATTPDPAAKLVLFAKLYDVAPDGSAKLNRALISAARVGDPTKPVTIELPGLVHRYDKGHALRLTLATSSSAHRGSFGSGPVTIKTDPASPGVLTIPRLGAQTGPVGSGPNGSTPFVEAPAATPGSKRLRRAAKLPKRRPCRRTPTRISFRLRAAKRLKVARIRVNGKRVKTIRGKRRLRSRITIRLVPGAKARVVVSSTMRSGEKRRNGRRYRACQA